MTLQQFVNTYNGSRIIDASLSRGGGAEWRYQCVSLIKQYLRDCFGINPGAWGNAEDYWLSTNSNLLNSFNKVGAPYQNGDILVIHDTPQNPYGHIGIIYNGQFLEQNGGAGTGSGTGVDAIRLRSIPGNVLGALRPKNNPQGGNDNVATLADRDIVNGFYAVLLGRACSDADAASWVGKPVDTVFWAIAGSPERVGFIRYIVQRFYNGFLQRAASEGEVDGWYGAPLKVQLDGIGTSKEATAVAEAFKSVPELRAQVNTLTAKSNDLVAKLAAAENAPVSDAQAAAVVAEKANPLVKFLQLVWGALTKKGN